MTVPALYPGLSSEPVSHPSQKPKVKSESDDVVDGWARNRKIHIREYRIGPVK